jgi:hypothetical protein
MLTEAAAPAPAPVVAPEAAAAAAAAPIVDAAALAVPPAPVVPAPPGIPIGSALPDMGLQLPSTLPIPTDLMCEGTAWSAERSDQPGGATPSAGRRDDW